MATKLVALDAGHGLKTAGKQTPDGVKEWTLNDKVRDKVVALLKDYDVSFIFPDNNEGNTDESLASRLKKYTQAGANAMVSIHHNAFSGTWNNATGVEVFTDKNPTTKDTALAKAIYKNLPAYTGLKGRGIKTEDWYVINQDKIPAVLVEGGFMDSRNDYKVITSDAGQTGYAKAVAEGLIEFLGLTKVSNSTATTKPSTTAKKDLGQVDITYQAYTDRWWDAVVNKKDWAGEKDKEPIRYLALKVSKGKIRARVYTEKNGWLPYLTFSNSYNLKDLNTGVLGDGSPIQAVELYYYTPDGYNYKKAVYRVSNEESTKFFAEQIDTKNDGTMDGYAGKIGTFIDKFQAWIE